MVAGPESFFAEVAIFQMVPSGAWTTPPTPQKDLAAGLSAVAPAASAASVSAWTVLGCETTSEIVKPRKPLVGASDCPQLDRQSRAERGVVEGAGRLEVGHFEGDGVDGVHVVDVRYGAAPAAS